MNDCFMNIFPEPDEPNDGADGRYASNGRDATADVLPTTYDGRATATHVRRHAHESRLQPNFHAQLPTGASTAAAAEQRTGPVWGTVIINR